MVVDHGAPTASPELLAAIAEYLRVVRMPSLPGFVADIAPSHPARREGFIATRCGSGPPLVFLPGLHADDIMLWGNRAALARHLTVIGVRYRQTGKPSPAQYGTDLLDLLDRLGLDSVHLLGESMGSLPAQWVAIHHPGRVRSLTLVGGFSRSPPAPLMALSRLGMVLLPAFAFRVGFHRRLRSILTRGGGAGLFAPEVVRAFVTMRGALQLGAAHRRLGMIARWDCTDQLGAIRCPFLYLGGAADGMISTRQEGARYAARLPGSVTRLIPGAPHLVMLSRPAACERSILDHVARAEGGFRRADLVG